MGTRTKLGTNLALKSMNDDHESSVIIKEEEKIVDYGNSPDPNPYQPSHWSTVILIQPKKN